MKKGQRLLWREAQEDRRLEQALRENSLSVLEAAEEIGRWFYSDKEGPEPTKAFLICRAYFCRRPHNRLPKQINQTEEIACKLEIAARLSVDEKARRMLGVRFRKGVVSDASILKAAHRLYEGMLVGDPVQESDIQTLRRHWDKHKLEWQAWAEGVPFSFFAEMQIKEIMERRAKKKTSWSVYLSQAKTFKP